MKKLGREVVVDERDSSRLTVIAPPPLELFPSDQLHEITSRPPPLPKEVLASRANGPVGEKLLMTFVALLIGMSIGSVGVLIYLHLF